jgi:hypothetical protein
MIKLKYFSLFTRNIQPLSTPDDRFVPVENRSKWFKYISAPLEYSKFILQKMYDKKTYGTSSLL